MANIRAYKLAEELGIDRHEIVEKAAEVGIELKNAMASLDDDEVALLREKLGGGDVVGGHSTSILSRREQRLTSGHPPGRFGRLLRARPPPRDASSSVIRASHNQKDTLHRPCVQIMNHDVEGR